MEIPIYLAMTSAEFLTCTNLPPRMGWMACHFSSCNGGLSNLPDRLPPESVLILDDSTPFQEHDCNLVVSQLYDAVSAFHPAALLLDFERPGNQQMYHLIKSITERLPCPVVVPSIYADRFDYPIFLPSGPLYQPLADYLKPYRKREIWLDAAPVRAQMVITPESAQYIPQAYEIPTDSCLFDTSLHCHYQTKVEEDQIIFTFSRTCADLVPWLLEAEQLGVCCAVGLYQELRDIAY